VSAHSLGLTSSTLRPKRLKSRRGIRARRHAEWKGKSELKRGTILKGPGSTIIYMICCYLKSRERERRSKKTKGDAWTGHMIPKMYTELPKLHTRITIEAEASCG
jgi:hypothetical protein